MSATYVVGRCRDGDRSSAPHVGVTQLVRQLLQFVSLEPVVIPENVIVSWSGGSLDSLVRAEIEVELCRMSDPNIHCGPGRNVAALPALFFLVRTEQSGERENDYFPGLT